MVEYKVKVFSDRTEWRNLDGQRHRENGPAVEYKDGGKEWWVDGKLHRLDGPAVEDVDGTKLWYVHNKLHRLDGPAVEYPNGDKQWWINGVYQQNIFLMKSPPKREMTMEELEKYLGYSIKIVK